MHQAECTQLCVDLVKGLPDRPTLGSDSSQLLLELC